jgi:uncharacterized protein (TIGR03437 family)
MRNRFSRTPIAVLALVFPLAALADFSNTQTISSGQYLNLATGAAGSSSTGADFLFSGTSITPQGSAGFFSFGPSGSGASSVYGEFTGTTLPFLGTYTSTPITGSNLVAGEIFAVKTNTGYYAKVWITAVSSSSLSLQYDTYGAPAGGNTPSISAVLDAGSYTPNIAQGSIFVVKGSNLSASGFTSTGFPLPTTFGNVSISFAPISGGTPSPAYIIYLYNQNGVNQLAALLPSATPTGTYNVTVMNGGASSSAFAVTVVKQKPGLITQDSTGNGLVVDQNYVSASEVDINRFTNGSINGITISPAHPGQTMIAWLTGMGPVPGVADNVASAGYNFAANGVTVQVLVNGVAITPAYAGRAPGASGEDQIDFTLPSNVTTGCTVPFQVSVNGNLSQPTFLSIAPAGSTACVLAGFTPSQLAAFDNGQTLTYGAFSVAQESGFSAGMLATNSFVDGDFVEYTGFELSAIPPQAVSGYTAPTGCVVTPINPSTTSAPTAGGQGILLDAGNLTISGPSGSGLNKTGLGDASGLYSLSLGAGQSVVAGAYTLTGAGGAGVGAFTANMTLPTPLTVTGGVPSVVNRSSGLTLNWTGGNASDGVVITGSAATISGTSNSENGALFICYTTAGAKTFTVGSSILDQLPAISASQLAGFTGLTSLAISTTASPTSGNGYFNAPLTAGGTISNATFVGYISVGNDPVYQ